MITKTYRLTTAQKSVITISVNGKKQTYIFDNGRLGEKRIGGYCVVTDEDAQLALEADPRFNLIYRLETVKESAEPVKKKEVVKEEKMPEGGIFSGVTNSQQAKKKLMEIFPELTHSKLPNKEAIIAFANLHEITFPDWTI